MLGLEATATARAQLRALKGSNPDLFEVIRERINAIRADPGGPARGRAFILDDGTTARLATYYDRVRRCDVALVWKVEPGEGAEAGTLKLVRAQHLESPS